MPTGRGNATSRAGSKFTNTSEGGKCNEEQFVSARISTRDERWFRACSKHVNTGYNAEDFSGSIANPGCVAEPVKSDGRSTAEFGPDAVLEQSGSVVLFIDDFGSPKHEQQRSVHQSGSNEFVPKWE